MGASKSAMGAAKQKAQRDRNQAAYMAKKGIKRTTYRDPITNRIVALGTIPGKIKGD